MNRDSLLEIAKRDQKHMALESTVAPVDILPTDLLTLLVDVKSEKSFRIVGFCISGDKDTRYFRSGREVWPSWIETWGTFGTGGTYKELFVYPSDPRIESSYPMKTTRVPAAEVRSETREFCSWYAVLTGNGVMLETWLKNRGFPAFNGAPAYCKVREATADEIDNYKAA